MTVNFQTLMKGFGEGRVLGKTEVVIAGEVMRISAAAGLWRKFSPESLLANFLDFLVDSSLVVERKLSAASCHESQFCRNEDIAVDAGVRVSQSKSHNLSIAAFIGCGKRI